MKFLLLLFLSLLAYPYCVFAQKTSVELSRSQDSLLGYWYFEGIDSSDSRAVQFGRKEVQKLYFSKDTLIVSNFGDETISTESGFIWSCTKGMWQFDLDTLIFYPKSSIGFSTNTGLYYYPGKPGSYLVRTLSLSFVLKKIDKGELIVDLIRPKKEQSITVLKGAKPVLEMVSRTYKKATILKMN